MPLLLAQVMIIPISQASRDYADKVRSEVRKQRFFVDVDHGDSKMEKKIREAQLNQYNYILVRWLEAQHCRPYTPERFETLLEATTLWFPSLCDFTSSPGCWGAGVESEYCERAYKGQPEARGAPAGVCAGHTQQRTEHKVRRPVLYIAAFSICLTIRQVTKSHYQAGKPE